MEPSESADKTPKRRTPLRVALIALAGLLLIGCAGLYRHFYRNLPMGSGPAGPAVPRAPFETVWTERKVVLLGLGDSMTEGYGASPGLNYFERLVANPEGEFEGMQGICLSRVLPNFQAQNRSQSGSTSLDHVEFQTPRLTPYPADVFGIIVFTTGGNDIIHNYGRTPPEEGAMYGATFAQAEPWIAAFEKRLDGMIDDIEKAFPGGCHVFLGNIYDPTDGIGDAMNAGLPRWRDCMKVLAAYNDILARCAARRDGVTLVDIHSAFMGHGIHCRQFWRSFHRREDPHYWFFNNLEDPNDRGYDAIRRLFLLEMIEVLADGSIEAAEAPAGVEPVTAP